jgi:hypothetical protein
MPDGPEVSSPEAELPAEAPSVEDGLDPGAVYGRDVLMPPPHGVWRTASGRRIEEAPGLEVIRVEWPPEPERLKLDFRWLKEVQPVLVPEPDETLRAPPWVPAALVQVLRQMAPTIRSVSGP